MVYSSDYLNYNILGLVAGTALISSEEVVLSEFVHLSVISISRVSLLLHVTFAV